MTDDSCSATTTMVAVDNNPFNLNSVALSNHNGQTAFSATFVGTTADAKTVTKTFEANDKKKWQRFEFLETFRNLHDVVSTEGDCVNDPATLPVRRYPGCPGLERQRRQALFVSVSERV